MKKGYIVTVGTSGSFDESVGIFTGHAYSAF